MFLTANLCCTGKSGSVHRLAKEVESSGVADRIRQEPGNEKYDYFTPMNDPEAILLVDSWKSQESLDAHHVSPMIRELADLHERYDLYMHIERYVSDENGIPDTD